MTDKEQRLIEEVAKLFDAEKYFLYDIEIANEGGKQYLRVFIDADDGINIDDCVAANKIVSDYFDEHDPLDDEYILEVSSPGIFRSLRTIEHFTKQLDKVILVKLKSQVDGIEGKKTQAVLSEVNETYIVVGDIKIPLDKIKKAETTYDFEGER